MSEISQFEVQRIVGDELEKLKLAIINNMRQADAVATGKTIASLVVETNPMGGTLYGRKFFGALETGRRPSTATTASNPPLYVRIMEWMQARNIQGQTERETKSIAFAIAKSINKHGTQLYQSGGRNTIYSQEIPKTIERISSQFSSMLVSEFKSIKIND